MGVRRHAAATKPKAPKAKTENLWKSNLSSQPSVPKAAPRSELAQALASCKSAFISIGLFSGMSNILMLTGAFFMLQVYDRVLPSRSVSTLVALAILVAVLFAFLAILDMIRNRILTRIGASLDEALSARVYDTIVRLPLRTGSRGDGLQLLCGHRRGADIPVGPWPDGVVRSALAALVSRRYLRLSYRAGYCRPNRLESS